MKSIALFPPGANSYTVEGGGRERGGGRGGLYERRREKLYKPEENLFAKEFEFRHIEIRTLIT